MEEMPSQKRTLRILISAGEISGEVYGAALVRELKKLLEPQYELEFFGLGGDAMTAEGVELVEHASKTGVIGIFEVAKRLCFFMKLKKKLIGLMDERKPDLLLTIDYPGMNLRLAAEAKARGIRTVHYVCPQVWAWKKDRIPKIAKLVDQLLCLFPFEPALFQNTELKPDFAGHPLVDQVARSLESPRIPLLWDEAKGDGAARVRKLAIFAGSRHNEVQRILPDVLAGAALAEKQLKEPCSFLLPAPTEERAAELRAFIERAKLTPGACPKEVAVVVGHSRQILHEADAAVVKSGTSTLEAALLGCPHFVVYRVSRISYWILSRLITGVNWIGLVNIVPNKSVCTELIQDALTPEAVCRELLRILTDERVYAQQKQDFAHIRELLGGQGATAQAAKIIAQGAGWQELGIAFAKSFARPKEVPKAKL